MLKWLQWIFLSTLLFQGQTEISDTNCDRSPIQIISVFDITVSNVSQFREQQSKLIETLRHLNTVTKGREVNYSLIAFHRLSVTLTSLNEQSGLNKVIEQVENLNPRYHLEKSAVRALHTALNQISNNAREGVKTLILLTHSDGLTSDTLLDILSVRSKLASLNATIFAISNSDQSPINSLLHFTNSNERIYTSQNDLPGFFNSIDSTINACLEDLQPNGISTHKAFGVKNSFVPATECVSNKVDLMILLDTSGSIQRTFEREQNLALELINGLNEDKFGSSLQVSVVEFAAEPTVVIGLRQHATKQSVLNRLRSIAFTGRITRIAKAVEFGLRELEENGNPNSTRIFVLISDGKSIDYWHDIKKIGEELKRSNANVFVASTSSEINFDEMLIYSANDKNKIFLGARDKIFPLAVSSLIQQCLRGSDKNDIKTIDSKSAFNEQFLPLHKLKNDVLPRKEEDQVEVVADLKTKSPSTGTLINDAQQTVVERPESLFTKVIDRKESSTVKKQFDDQTKNLFNDLNNDEIIANTTEIDEFEASGQEVKTEEVELISHQPTVKQRDEKQQQNETINCSFDLFFIVESGHELKDQLDLSAKIVEKIPETLVPNQIQLYLISISKNNPTKAQLIGNNTKLEFLDALIESKSDMEMDLSELIESIQSSKRSDSQLINLFLFNDDSIQKLFNLLSPLKSLIFDNKKSNNSQDFVQQSIDLLHLCISSSIEKKFNEFVENGRKTLESCDNDPIDLFIVLSPLSTSTFNFASKIQLLTNYIRQLSVADFLKRIRVSITLYTETSQLVIPLRSALAKDDVLIAIDQIKYNETQVQNIEAGVKSGISLQSISLASGLKTSLSDILPAKRAKARLVGLLIVDQELNDTRNEILDVYQTLKNTQSHVDILVLNETLNSNSIGQYVGGDLSKVHGKDNIEKFFTDARNNLFNCQNRLHSKLEDELHVDVFDEKDISNLFRRSDNSVQSGDQNSSEPGNSLNSTESCKDIDLILVIDTSTSVELEYNQQVQFATDLIKHLPDHEFEAGRIQVGLVSFYVQSKVELPLGTIQQKEPLLSAISSIKHTGGSTFIANGMKEAIGIIKKKKRSNAQSVVVLISDGNSQDEWNVVLEASAKLRLLNANVYALTASKDFSFRELEVYADKNVFTSNQFDQFLKQIDSSIFVGCSDFPPLFARDEKVTTTTKTTTVSSTTSIKTTTTPIETTTLPSIIAKNKDSGSEFAARDESLTKSNNSILNGKGECNFAKIDLIFILDASTSREEVFEHQRELALSLIERLPISRKDTHVAIGLNTFNHAPTLRLNLGLGRDRNMVRKAIEQIEFNGGSTLTSQAVDLAIKDLAKGRRNDAKQIVILMNDGMSQDPWELVQKTSDRLAKTNAEVFGVALGQNVDLRELQLYVREPHRLYKDGAAETERFLQDVVSLLRNNDNCPLFFNDPEEESETTELPPDLMAQTCEKPKLDLFVLFDNSDNTANMTSPKLNSNRYLLLDVLGSLPLGSQVNVAVFAFAQNVRLEFDLTSEGEKDVLFEKVEAIQARKGQPSYANALQEVLLYYKRNHRSNARSLLLIIGDGQNSTDRVEERELVANQIKQTAGLISQAVHSGKNVDLETLVAYTGSISQVYNYDRNAEFAKSLLQLATTDCNKEEVSTSTTPTLVKDQEFQPLKSRDIAPGIAEGSDKSFVGDSEKLLKKPAKLITAQTLEPTTTTQKSTTTVQEITTLKTTKLPETTKTTKLLETTKISKLPETTNTTKLPETTKTDKLSEARKTTSAPKTTTKPYNAAKLLNVTSNCLVDLMLIIDSSGSVNETIEHSKRIATKIIEQFNIGSDSTHISIVKFSSKARTLHSFNDNQTKEEVLEKLNEINLSFGTTAIHAGLLQAISEYTQIKGARLGKAQSLAVIFTDGFGQKDMGVEAELLRETASLYAIGINHQFPVARKGLELITADSRRVFTDATIDDFYLLLQQKLSKCQ